MLIFLLAYLGGVLTIVSPCVLPVLPFIFARSDKPFMQSGLPVLIGMAATFALLASLISVGGAWVVEVNKYGRFLAMALLLLMGLALVFPSLSGRLMQPFISLGNRLQTRAAGVAGVGGPLLIGVAVGFLWAPCAGPILGLLLAGTALRGANLESALLLFVFAAGAATSIAVVLFAGNRVVNLLKRGLGMEEWLRRIIGAAVIFGVVVIFMGWDTRFLAKFTVPGTAATEQKLIRQLKGPAAPAAHPASEIPPLAATLWLNSPPLTAEALRGKVVLVDFWTYSCINCLRTLPYIEAWDKKYRSQGLVIIGVHSPEFAFEKDRANVERAVRELGVEYPVAMDNRYAIWNAFGNQYWPAHYLFDAKGKLRDEHFGEGAYVETEEEIRKLLTEAHANLALGNLSSPLSSAGAMAAAGAVDRSPETYLGYARAENFSSPEPVAEDSPVRYTSPRNLRMDHWALAGKWMISAESATSQEKNASIAYRFRGRDLHLVLGASRGKPVRFRVTLDGRPPGGDHGADTDAEGFGTIREERLYQLVRQAGKSSPRDFKIEFLDPGARAFAFTFG